MGFFDEEPTTETELPDTDLSGPVPNGKDTDDFFAQNQEEAPAVEEAVEEAPATPEQDVFAETPTEPASQVPIADLLLERRRRQQMEGELQEQKQTLAVMNERIMNAQRHQQMQEMQEMRKEQALQNPAPDPEEDPIGAANYRIQHLETQLREVAQATMQQQEAAQAQVQNQEQEAFLGSVVQQSQNMQNQFAQEKGDYWDAFQHLVESRTSELKTMGYDGHNLQQIIDNEKGMIVNSCIQRDANGNMSGWKQNPAEVAYNLAQQRGYVDAATRQAQQQQAQQQQQQQQAAVPVAREPVQVSAQDRMNMMNKGVQAAQSAGNFGATANQGVLSLDQLAEMSDTQFEQFQKDNPGIVDVMLGS